MNDINTILQRLEQKTKKTKSLNALEEKPTSPSTPEIVKEYTNTTNTLGNNEYIIKDGKRYINKLVEVCITCSKPKGSKKEGECRCGRPRTFATPDILWLKCLDYFDECRFPKPITRMFDVIDPTTKKVKREKRTIEGEKKHITLTGLLVHLGLTWDTWTDYSEDKQFSDVTKRARFYVESEYEQRLNKPNGQVTGPLFILKNKYGYKDQQENINTNLNLDAVIDELDKPKVIDAEIL